ncbi:MAG: hypothetical protein U5J62_02600 [Desulfurivibrio sp.]|nr:hypothetical protein [Desulfurivibrio sp.]
MKQTLLTLLLCTLLLGAAPAAFGAEQGSCAEISAKVDVLGDQVSGDMRRIQRELAALKAEIAKPGLSEVFAGIGYICGLFGVAFFLAGRRQKG